MSAINTQCPPESMLSDFGLGKLDPAQSETIGQHLETCADCRQRVANLSGDSFVNRLRGVPERIDRTFVAGDSASNAAHSSETPSPEDGLPRPSRTVEDKQKLDGLGSPSSAPPELTNHPDYEIIKELGQGGMGVVYLAKNRMMDRLEVLKVVSKSLLDKPGALERFQQEIRSAAKLLHPNIVAAHAVLRPGDLLVFAMEYVPGQDLMQVVKKRGYLPIANATFYAHQVALGLQHAHEKGMVHRDIKPNNLMLAIEGKKHVVKILDFGLAKATSEKAAETALTKSGQMLGTPDYIAPEQTLDAHKADIRADIYSLGCTLYYFLAGRPPFQESSLYALLEAHQRRDAQPLNLVRPDVPVELAAVVAKMLAKDPAKRYQTPLEVARALTPFFKPGQTTATAATPSTENVPSHATAETATSAVSPTETWLPVQPSAVPGAAPSPVVTPVPIPIRAAAPAESGISIDTHRATPRRAGWWKTRPPWQRYASTAGAAALLLLAIVLSIQTPHGTVEIAISDPKANVTVTVDKDNIDIAGLDEPLSLEVGEHDLKVTGNGYETVTKKFTVTKGKNAPLTVTLVPDKSDHEREVAKWVLSRGGKVRIEGKEVEIVDASQLPAGAIDLASVDMDGIHVMAGDLARLQSLPSLATLDLSRTRINDAELAQLQGLPQLTTLSLFNTYITSAGLRCVSKFKELKHLSLIHSKGITNEGMQHFSELPKLTELKLYGTSVTGEGLQHLRNRTSLQQLVLDDLPIEDDALASLVELRALTHLRLPRTLITDAGLEHLKRLTNLTDLDLGGTKVTQEGVASLQAALPNCKIVTSLGASATPSTVGAPAGAAAPATPAQLGSTPLEHKKPASCCRFSPDGKLLATGGQDGIVKIWDAATGKNLHEIDIRETVQDVTFSPDSKIFLTWTGGSPRGNSAKWKPKFWDSATAKKVTTFPITRSIVGPLAFSTDGTLMAAVGKDATVDLFDAPGKPIGSFAGQRGAISCLAISPDSKLLACGSDALVLKLWNVVDKRELLTQEPTDNKKGGFAPHVHTVLFSNDGRYLVAGMGASTLVYDVSASKALWKKRTNTWRAYSLAISPDNKFVVATGGRGESDHFAVFDALTGKTIRSVPAWRGYQEGYRGAEAIALSPDGDTLASAGPDNTIKIWDTATWEQTREAASRGNVGGDAVTAKSSQASSPSKAKNPAEPPAPNIDGWKSLFNGRDLTGWNVVPGTSTSWKVEDGILIGSGEPSLLFSQRGDYSDFAFRVEAKINAGGNSGQFFRAEFGSNGSFYEAQIAADDPEATTGSLYMKSASAAPADKIAVGPHHRPGEWFTQEVTALGNHIVIKVNGETVVDHVDHKYRLAKGHLALQLHRVPGTVVQFRRIEVKELTASTTSTGAKEPPLEKRPAAVPVLTRTTLLFNMKPDFVVGAALSPDGTKVMAGNNGGTHLWNAETGQLLRDFAHHRAPRSIAFVPDGSRAITGDWEGVLGLWDIATGERIGGFEGNNEGVYCITVSDDARFALTCSAGKGVPPSGYNFRGNKPTVHLWDLQTLKELRRLDGINDRVSGAAFLPHTHRVVWGTLDGTLWLWDADTGNHVDVVVRGGPAFRHVTLAADGQYVGGTMSDNSIVIWDLLVKKRIRQLAGHPKESRSSVFSPDGSHLLSISAEDARLWDVASGEELARTKGNFGYCAIYPDGAHALLTEYSSGQAYKWPLPQTPGRPAATKPNAGQPVPQETKNDHEREVAEWVLSKGGKVQVHGGNGDIIEAAKLPPGSIALKAVNLANTAVADADLSRVQDLSGLTDLNLSYSSIGDNGLAQLKSLPNLRSLEFARSKVTDAGMQYVAQFRQLKILHLFHNTNVGDDGLTHLQGLPLKCLTLWGTQVTGKGLRNLKHLPLRGLFLNSLPVHDDDLAELREMRFLWWLDLDDTQVTDAGLEHLKTIPTLTRVWARHTKCTQAGIDSIRAALPKCSVEINGSGPSSIPMGELMAERDVEDGDGTVGDHQRTVAEWVLSKRGKVKVDGVDGEIADVAKLPTGTFSLTEVDLARVLLKKQDAARLDDLPSVVTLNLQDTLVDDQWLSSLAPLPQMRKLNLHETSLTAAGVDHLKGFPRLEEIYVSAGDDVIARLTTLSALKKLDFYGSSVTNAALGHIRNFKSLTFLSACGRRLDDDGLANLSSDSLEYLVLWGSSVQGTGLKKLRGLPKLHTLWLHDLPIHDDDLRGLEGLPSLRGLGIGRTQITDKGLEILSQLKLPALMGLEIEGTQVTDAGLEHLKRLTNLKGIRANRTKLTQQGVDSLRAALPNCKIEWP